jgi:hypothetical protein
MSTTNPNIMVTYIGKWSPNRGHHATMLKLQKNSKKINRWKIQGYMTREPVLGGGHSPGFINPGHVPGKKRRGMYPGCYAITKRYTVDAAR